MSAVNNPLPEAIGDTRINVASLLMEPVGATRDMAFGFGSFSLDDDLIARDVTGDVKLTRLQHQLLASGRLRGIVTLECVRCLDEYDHGFDASFTEVFRQSVDVRTGAAIPEEEQVEDVDMEFDEDSGFVIDEGHQLDVGEAFRQWILLSLPMRPNCGPDCKGPLLTATVGNSEGDGRLAGLAALLDDEEA